MIFISQLFGLFPISGLCSKDPRGIKFSWLSLRTLFSASFVVSSISFTFLVLYRQMQAGPLTPSNIVGIIFFANTAMICILFFKFSMKFGLLMEQWRNVEKVLQKSNHRENVINKFWSLKRRIIICTAVGLFTAFIEHLLSLSTNLQRTLYVAEKCNWTSHNFFKDFVTKHLTFTFSVINYSHFTGVIAEYLNFSLTFYWNFLDIFLMVISIGLSHHYEKIYNRIKFFKDRIINDQIWAEVRSDYNQVSELLKFMDASLDKMILLACFNDSYFILVQLLNISS